MRTFRRRLGSTLMFVGVLLIAYAARGRVLARPGHRPVRDLQPAESRLEAAGRGAAVRRAREAGAGGRGGVDRDAGRAGRAVGATAEQESEKAVETVYRLQKRFAKQYDKQLGTPIGRLNIPGMGLSTILVEGTDRWSSLTKGPGRYGNTSFPGSGSTIGIAGHRTTFSAPFRNIDDLNKGDKITLKMPYGTFVYRVRAHKIVKNNDWSIIKQVGHEQLVLSACHPLYSASHRWVVFADLVTITLPGSVARPRRSDQPAARARRTSPAAPAASSPFAGRDQHQAAGGGGPRDLVRRVGQRMDRARPRPGPAGRASAARAAARPSPAAASRAAAGSRPSSTSTSGRISRCSPTSADSGLPGQAEHDRAGRRAPGPDRLARLDRHAPEQLLDAERGERRLDVVARARPRRRRSRRRGRPRAPRRTAAPSPRACPAPGRRARRRTRTTPASRPSSSEFESCTWPRRSGDPGATSSSPGGQHDRARPAGAADAAPSPAAASDETASAVSIGAALDDDRAAGDIGRPATHAGADRDRRRARTVAPSLVASSMATTASAPSGSTPPVAIEAAAPGGSGGGSSPAETANATGSSRSLSAARSAKPSSAELSQPGRSTSACCGRGRHAADGGADRRRPRQRARAPAAQSRARASSSPSSV